ncbi:MAG: ABC transporter permease [Pseudomonadota bacterium]
MDTLEVKEIWAYRDLLYFLVWRDVLVRYKQTALGVAWALLQPLTSMVIFAVVFGRFAGLPSDGRPYPVFCYTGLILWTLFAQSVTMSANSLIVNEKLVTKIYFPRIIIPLSAIVACLPDFAIACTVSFILFPYYGLGLPANIWAAPLMIALVLAAGAGTGLFLSAMNVTYRDFRYVVPFMIQIWMFASPVAYPAAIIPEGLRLVFALNPLAGAIEGFRWALLGTPPNPWPMVAVSAAAAMTILFLGLVFFQRSQDEFADII